MPSDGEIADSYQKILAEIHAAIMTAYEYKVDYRVVALLDIVGRQLELLQSLHERVVNLEQYNYHG